MIQGAFLSGCRQYRYLLWRIWDREKSLAAFIGLNPSTANAYSDDPTLRRCMSFARRWQFGGVMMANLFAYRSRSPAALKHCADPTGPYNTVWLNYVSRTCPVLIACWGNGGLDKASDLFPGHTYQCLGTTKKGAPRHPLYVSSTQRLQPFTVSLNSAE